ncbi:MAG: AlpA family phage regulatory protein [Ideonella sp.]|nr:AlpA family phage regulatory protein [Ideonella sp.]MCC7458022.1 AlpA family transcriptional regulator [Nitrospira sp.]
MDDRLPARPTPAADPAPTPMFLRIGVVMRITGLGRSTIYRMMAEDDFPQPVRLTRRLVAWRRADLDQWSDRRPRATH